MQSLTAPPGGNRLFPASGQDFPLLDLAIVQHHAQTGQGGQCHCALLRAVDCRLEELFDLLVAHQKKTKNSLICYSNNTTRTALCMGRTFFIALFTLLY